MSIGLQPGRQAQDREPSFHWDLTREEVASKAVATRVESPAVRPKARLAHIAVQRPSHRSWLSARRALTRAALSWLSSVKPHATSTPSRCCRRDTATGGAL